ncbi:unnamed protein product, partial [Candidula unifasciata]
VSEILKKPEQERTTQDKTLVKKNPELVKVSQQNARKLQNKKDRILEVEDEPRLLQHKCQQLAELIKSSRNVIVYTGAGISTAASIPDYRGPNGVWTLLKRGQELSAQDLSDAEPTFTHMSLTKLFTVKKVKHIVSQNCDGLHLRSGFPRQALSELHGNMYLECCYSCVPNQEFVRLFDVTELTGFHRHSTSRFCRSCGGNLQDTIVHFGEKGKLKSPYRWKEAVRAAKQADLILCLGSSLKVLRKYSCLWCMDRKRQQRPKLVIVNLQWTPKDDGAALKINGKCDTVMMNVMALLNYKVPEYKREQDPIFKLYTPLRLSEMKTTTKKILIPPAQQGKKSRKSTTYISDSAARRKSCRITNSAEKRASWFDKKYSKPSIESVESDHFSLNDAKRMEKDQINSNKENLLNKDVTVPSARIRFDQHKSAEYRTCQLHNLNPDRSQDVTNLQLCHTSATFWDLSDKLCEKSIQQPACITCCLPQKLKTMSDHYLCDCKIDKDGLKMTCSTLEKDQYEKCRSFHCCCVLHERQSSTLDNCDIYKHEDNISFQNTSIPELVVVNLGKHQSQKCRDQNIFENQLFHTADTILLVTDLATDNTLSHLVSDVCENSSSLVAAHSSAHTLDSLFRHHAASNDCIHSSTELNNSPVHVKSPHFVGPCLQVTSDYLKSPHFVGPCLEVTSDHVKSPHFVGPCLEVTSDHVKSPHFVGPCLQVTSDHVKSPHFVGPCLEVTSDHVKSPHFVGPCLEVTSDHVKSPHFVGPCLEVTSGSDMILLPAREDAEWDQCTDALFSNQNCLGSSILIMEHNESNNTKGQLNKTLQTFQPVKETINNICHDHCYTQAETTVTHQLQTKLPWLQTTEFTENSTFCCSQGHVNCFTSDDLTKHPEVPVTGKCSEANLQYDLDSVCLLEDIYLKPQDSLCHLEDIYLKPQDSVCHLEDIYLKPQDSVCHLEDIYLKPQDSVCHLEDIYLKPQQNLDKKEVANNVMNKCHQISEVLHVQNGGINDTERRENICKQMRRRKPSVPGWFGKGLFIKKNHK